MTDYMLVPDQSLFAVHYMRDVTGEEALTADYYYHWKTIVGGKQKIWLFGLSVVRSGGVLNAALVVVHYDTLWEMEHLHPMLINHFEAHQMPYVFAVGLLSGWFHVMWAWQPWCKSSSSWTSCRSCWSGQRFSSTSHLTWNIFSQLSMAVITNTPCHR